MSADLRADEAGAGGLATCAKCLAEYRANARFVMGTPRHLEADRACPVCGERWLRAFRGDQESFIVGPQDRLGSGG